MASNLECGSDAVGRYTCRYAPQPSVCCPNGCCADPAFSGDGAHRRLSLWGRIGVAVSIGLVMVLVFLLLRCRDRRGYRAYKLQREHQLALAVARQQLQQQQQQQEAEEARAVPSGPHEPAREARE